MTERENVLGGLRTFAITHRIYEGNVRPLTEDEIKHFIDEHLIAIGTNWRDRPDQAWPDDDEEFRLFGCLAGEGGVVIANYQGLGTNQRIVGRVDPQKLEHWHNLRVLQLRDAKPIDVVERGVEGLNVHPGRTIIEVTDRAKDRVAKLLPVG